MPWSHWVHNGLETESCLGYECVTMLRTTFAWFSQKIYFSHNKKWILNMLKIFLQWPAIKIFMQKFPMHQNVDSHCMMLVQHCSMFKDAWTIVKLCNLSCEIRQFLLDFLRFLHDYLEFSCSWVGQGYNEMQFAPATSLLYCHCRTILWTTCRSHLMSHKYPATSIDFSVKQCHANFSDVSCKHHVNVLEKLFDVAQYSFIVLCS